MSSFIVQIRYSVRCFLFIFVNKPSVEWISFFFFLLFYVKSNYESRIRVGRDGAGAMRLIEFLGVKRSDEGTNTFQIYSSLKDGRSSVLLNTCTTSIVYNGTQYTIVGDTYINTYIHFTQNKCVVWRKRVSRGSHW